jgi:hypothetical protein
MKGSHPFLGNRLGAAPDAIVVYRLSDTVNALPCRFCAVENSAQPANDGISQYRKLLGEIRQNAAAVVVSDQLEISIIADSALQARATTPTPSTIASPCGSPRRRSWLPLLRTRANP